MKKRFNTTGVCVPRKHYMADITNKLVQIKELIDNEFYFTINKPRQYGKTTTINELKKYLKDEYLVIDISFEGIGDAVFEKEEEFCNVFIELVSENLEITNEEEYNRLVKLAENVNTIKALSKVITKFIKGCSKEAILFIDEVDKSSNNQLFLSFIGMLRNKYLAREVDADYTFKSVILVGLYDVKSLKLKLRPESGSKYNSPWNIAVDFEVDMSFSKEEISTMLSEYSRETNISVNIDEISTELYFMTSGYPFLVSRLCNIIDEKLHKDDKEPWTKDDVVKAVKLITNEDNTLFQSIVKNLENNSELYNLVNRILINGEIISFNILDPVINLGVTFGIFSNVENRVSISNKIFEEVLYNYMVSKFVTKTKDMSFYNFKNDFITADGGLDIEKILTKFQQYMKENYSDFDSEFIEREGRLIFLAFITPIINGIGFALKEAQVSQEKRLDLFITYNKYKYIVELKVWRGPKYHEDGINQLCDYLDIHNLEKGYLLVFNFNKNKEYKKEKRRINNKDILEVFV